MIVQTEYEKIHSKALTLFISQLLGEIKLQKSACVLAGRSGKQFEMVSAVSLDPIPEKRAEQFGELAKGMASKFCKESKVTWSCAIGSSGEWAAPFYVVRTSEIVGGFSLYPQDSFKVGKKCLSLL